MGRYGYGLFVAGIATLFAAGALGASCTLETAGITGSTSSTSGTPIGTGGAGGANGVGGQGTGGEPPLLDPETCPGAEVRVPPDSMVTRTNTLFGKSDDVKPSCTAAGATGSDLIYRVLPEADGTLKVSLSGTEFKGSLSIRSSCEDSAVPIEFGCATDPLFQQVQVRANAPYYVVVDGPPSNFTLTFILSPCGDGSTQGCDGDDCKGCVACKELDEFWDDSVKKQRCYKLVLNPASFTAARSACLAWGGDLAGINDAAEFKFLREMDSIASAGDVWVGGYAREPACSYVWTDGEPGFLWSGFGLGEPSGSPEKCIGLRRDGVPAYSFDDKPCDTPRSYLCERAPAGTCGDGVIQPGEECDDRKDKSCHDCLVQCGPDEFKDEISHHCYWLGKDAATWEAAEKDCEHSKGGYLAVITSTEENALITKRVGAALGAGAEVWIDLKVTLTVPPIGYWDRPGERALCSPHWQMDQPRVGGGLCTTIHDDGYWTNRDCMGAHSYVCERGP